MTEETERDALIAWLYVDQRRSLTGVALDPIESERLADGFLAWMRENGYVRRHDAMLRELHHFETEQAITEALALDAEHSDRNRMSDDVRAVLVAALAPEAEREPVVVDDATPGQIAADAMVGIANGPVDPETVRELIVHVIETERATRGGDLR